MEMQQVKYFLALSQALNFTRAAEAANVSQPALTRAIQQLEHELGGPLFHRERGNTHLSELGRIVLPYFEAISSQVQAARDHALRVKRMDVATLRIAAMSTVGPVLLCDLLMKVRNDHPNVEFDVIGESLDGAIAALREGKVDIALVAGSEEVSGRFHTVTLSEERLVVVVSPDHAFAAKNAVGLDDLDGQAFVHRTNCQIFESIARLLCERGVQLKKVLSSGRDDWVQEMVRAGIGFAVMPESSVTDPRLVVRRLIAQDAVRTVVLATARGRPHSPAVGAFISAARTAQAVRTRPREQGGWTGERVVNVARRAPRLRLVGVTA